MTTVSCLKFVLLMYIFLVGGVGVATFGIVIALLSNFPGNFPFPPKNCGGRFPGDYP